MKRVKRASTRARLATATLLLAVTPCCNGGCEIFKTQISEEKRYHVKTGTVIEVKASHVSVSVSPGKPGLVSLHTTKRTRAFWTSRRLQKNIHLAVKNEPGRLIITEKHPKDIQKYRVALILTVPPDSPVHLHMEGGDVTLTKLKAPATVNTRNKGRVTSHDVVAQQVIRLGRGPIQLQYPGAPFQVRNKSGPIRVVLKNGLKIRGLSKAETQEGRIHLSAAHGCPDHLSVLAPPGRVQSDIPLTKSGKAQVAGGPGPCRIHLTAVQGYVEIYAPSE
jgi:hypothetical protein